MNMNEFVEQVAQILFDADVRLAYEEDYDMLSDSEIKLSEQRRNYIVNLYREFFGDSIMVNVLVPMDCSFDQLATNVYSAIWRDLKNHDNFSRAVDDAIWRKQTAKDPDYYMQDAEDRLHP